MFPREVGDGVHNEIFILMRHPAGEEQRLALVLVPFQNAVAADPEVVSVYIAHLIAQVVDGSLFPQHTGDVLPEQILKFRCADPFGPLLQQPGDQILREPEVLFHIVGDEEEILLHIAQVKIAGVVILRDRVEQGLHVTVRFREKGLKGSLR